MVAASKTPTAETAADIRNTSIWSVVMPTEWPPAAISSFSFHGRFASSLVVAHFSGRFLFRFSPVLFAMIVRGTTGQVWMALSCLLQVGHGRSPRCRGPRTDAAWPRGRVTCSIQAVGCGITTDVHMAGSEVRPACLAQEGRCQIKNERLKRVG